MKVLIQPNTTTAVGSAPRRRKAGFIGGTGQAEDVRVLVVDDNDVLHLGFRLLLTSQPWVHRCVVTREVHEAVEFAARYKPHIAIVDPATGGRVGSELTDMVRGAAPTTRFILAGNPQISVRMARRLGFSALLPDRPRAGEVIEIVRHVAAGGQYFPRSEPHDAGLSAREREVLDLIIEGATNREIARCLHLAPDTVKQHAAAIYRKLGVRNRTEAARRAGELGIEATQVSQSSVRGITDVASA